ncbi:shikimate kinase [Thermophagus sp. OGC60D27]|uniref:shikimate kinase n=1 Tax=Thermophagus sp. OGC60D27 TaxID=3458415 RepID=UPI00403767F6
MKRPIYLTGFMGSGKSTFGSLLAKTLNREFIDLDLFIEKQEGESISSLFSKYGENEFRKKEHKALLSTGEMKNVVIATGGGTPCFFDNMSFMNRHGITIYLKVDPEHLLKRLLPARSKRPLIAEKEESELRQFINTRLSERSPYYHQSHIIADTSALSPTDTLRMVTKALELH